MEPTRPLRTVGTRYGRKDESANEFCTYGAMVEIKVKNKIMNQKPGIINL
jgi:hypothetical protein